MSSQQLFPNWIARVRFLVALGWVLVGTNAVAAPMRYELDLTPTATHASMTWDHDVPLYGSFDCNACHTGAAGDFAPSGTVNTPTQTGTFLLAAMKLRYYGDSANVKEYPDSATGDTASAQGHYLAVGRATVTVPLARKTFLHVRSVSVGQAVCAILTTGDVDCWGRNRFGGVGNGWDQDSSIPTSTFGLPASVRQIAGYYRHTCAVTSDGAVWCWGENQAGQLGDGSCPWQDDFGDCFSPYPSQVLGLPGPVQSVTVGSSFTCARLLTGSVWCWGGDNYQLPAQISGLGSVVAVSAAYSTACALRSDGTVWCWDSSLQTAPQKQNLSQVRAVSGTCALRSDRTVWCWYTGTPQQVVGLSGVTSIDSDDYSAGCALRSDGTVWCWDTSLVPSQIGGLSGITAISRGGDYADVICAVRSDRSLWCLNDNEWGQLGNPTTDYSSTPVPVISGATWQNVYLDAPRVYTGSFDPVDALFVSTDNSHHAIGIGSGWPPTGQSAGTQAPPFSPTYPGGLMSDQYGCDPGNPDDYGCGTNASAIDGYDLRSGLAYATGHKISSQVFPNDTFGNNGPLSLLGGGSIQIDPIMPTDSQHSSVGYLGSFSATALTPMARLTARGGATGATVAAGVTFNGVFVLGTGGKAFAPASDDIVFGYGPYTAYLPAGTLSANEESGASYSGQINGSPVQISIRLVRGSTYSYRIAAQNVDLSTLVGPANLDIYIGDNAGSARPGTQ